MEFLYFSDYGMVELALFAEIDLGGTWKRTKCDHTQVLDKCEARAHTHVFTCARVHVHARVYVCPHLS